VTFTFWKLYVLELLHCVQLRFVTLRHVTFTLCCFTLCSNIVLSHTFQWSIFMLFNYTILLFLRSKSHRTVVFLRYAFVDSNGIFTAHMYFKRYEQIHNFLSEVLYLQGLNWKICDVGNITWLCCRLCSPIQNDHCASLKATFPSVKTMGRRLLYASLFLKNHNVFL
jgi:hypothetical protein